MKKKVLVLVLIVNALGLLQTVTPKEVSCDTVRDVVWNPPVGKVKSCLMGGATTVIEEDNVTISSRDESILGLSSGGNKKIKVLPVGVVDAFPNLLFYGAWDCKIKNILKKNFAGLNKLKILSLSSNQIEKIYSDTFNDLVSLEKLHLYENKIKFLNGETFQGLNKLAEVWLSGNVCINEQFLNSTRIAVLQQTVNEKCHFEETRKTTIAPISIDNGNNDKVQVLETSLAKSNATIATLKAELISKDSKVATLNEQITNLTADNDNLKTKLKAAKETMTESAAIKGHLEDCKSDKTKLSMEKQELKDDLKTTKVQCQQRIDFVEKLNGEVNEKLQQKEAEIVDNKAEIEKLKKKVENLLGFQP